jgi:hypothetical protein
VDDAPANLERTRSGRVRPVCEFCGRKGRAVQLDESGRVHLHQLGQGWSEAPYPADLVHRDGSTGDLFTCPACDTRLRRGESLLSRGESEGARAAAERAKAALREAGAMD